MATPNDPTKPVLRAVEKYQERLFELWKVIFKKINSKFNAARKFFDNVVTKGQDIASKVGQAVVDKIVGFRQRLFSALEAVPNIAKSAIKLGNKIIALIRKAADPNKIIGTLKRLFSRYVKMLREILGYVADLVGVLDPLGKALAVIDSFKNVLRLVVSWVAEVSAANAAVKKAKTMLKKVIKTLKREVKEATLLRKEVLNMRPS